jgi:hypothetical protein
VELVVLVAQKGLVVQMVLVVHRALVVLQT